jgi:uncharacterized protein YqjF (DUF2071 family)
MGGSMSSLPAALAEQGHRPWPLSEKPWVARQSWLDLCFAHWPIEASRIRHLVPGQLEIDEREGSSWIGVVPFHMSGVTPRGLPDLPLLSAFPELNVRLYVRLGDKPGVWFLSLDADSALAVWGARTFYYLPYYRARMSVRPGPDGLSYFSSRRSGAARFVARYWPTSEVMRAPAGSLEHWLTERYCLYAQSPRGTLVRTDVHHLPWPLQSAEIDITENSMLAPVGLRVEGRPPLCHFARRLDVVVWAPEACA